MAIREQVAGIDITETGVAAACIASARGGVVVTHAWFEPLPPEAPSAEVAHRIRKVWHRGGFRTRTVAAALNSGALLVRHFRYEGLSEDEARSALRLEAEESLQIPAKDLCTDVHLVRAPGNSGEGRCEALEGLMVAAPRDAVNGLVRLLAEAGLFPVLVDVGAMAVCNLWLYLNAGREGDEVVFAINLTHRQAHMVILDRGGRAYPRTVVCGSSDWTGSLDYLAENILSQIEYAETNLGFAPTRKVLLTGETPADPAMMDRLAAATELGVEAWTPLADPSVRKAGRVRVVSDDLAIARRMTVSLGLALRGLDGNAV